VKIEILRMLSAAALLAASPVCAQWPPPKAPAVPEADGYVAGAPLKNGKFVIVFHGAAIDGILDEAHYKTKFGVSNPNLEAIAKLKKAGAELFVCGQNLAFAGIDPKVLTPLVTVASDALIVLMKYENDGYALLSF
jgi:intracellular sulfur oxidation DsrE/DsrF family protein